MLIFLSVFIFIISIFILELYFTGIMNKLKPVTHVLQLPNESESSISSTFTKHEELLFRLTLLFIESNTIRSPYRKPFSNTSFQYLSLPSHLSATSLNSKLTFVIGPFSLSADFLPFLSLDFILLIVQLTLNKMITKNSFKFNIN